MAANSYCKNDSRVSWSCAEITIMRPPPFENFVKLKKPPPPAGDIIQSHLVKHKVTVSWHRQLKISASVVLLFSSLVLRSNNSPPGRRAGKMN